MNYEPMNKRRIIDSHIHLDKYEELDQQVIIQSLQDSSTIDGLIAVSMDLASCRQNLQLAKVHPFIHPAFGYHPEQQLLTKEELEQLLAFMTANVEKMIAVGEVGLPYYLRVEDPTIPLAPYIELLETFIIFAKSHELPIILHAVYEDAEIACDLLEKHAVKKAHFHWFKGSKSVTKRMIDNGYYISFTPDCIYENEIQTLVKNYPIDQVFVETDGPWPFSGPFENKMTHPDIMHDSIKTIASLKKLAIDEVYQVIYENTKRFYNL